MYEEVLRLRAELKDFAQFVDDAVTDWLKEYVRLTSGEERDKYWDSLDHVDSMLSVLHESEQRLRTTLGLDPDPNKDAVPYLYAEDLRILGVDAQTARTFRRDYPQGFPLVPEIWDTVWCLGMDVFMQRGIENFAQLKDAVLRYRT